MNYIYDISLNFNDEYFEFYEWNKEDKITSIRKIPIFKVNNSQFYDFKMNNIILEKSFLELINNHTEYFLGQTIKLMTSFLITDGLDIVAIKIDKNMQYSSLLIDEELDILENNSIKETNIKYQIISKKEINNYQTRNKQKKEFEIKNNLKILEKEKNKDKIKYIYYECFNEKEKDINKMLKKLKNSLNNGDVISKLYNLFDNKIKKQ